MILDAYIQARMASTRLPGKMMLKFGDKTILEHVIDRVKQFKGVREIVLLTTPFDEDDCLRDIASDNGIIWNRYSSDLPIDRYIFACESMEPDWFLRVCGDSPFMSVEMTDKLIDSITEGPHYMAYQDKKYPSIMGLAPELVKTEPFLKRYAAIQEHVTYQMYDHSDNVYIQKPKELSDKYFRITIDKPEDYEFMLKVWDHFKCIPEWRELQKFIISNCPERIENEV